MSGARINFDFINKHVRKLEPTCLRCY
jgi:hypothetical protein